MDNKIDTKLNRLLLKNGFNPALLGFNALKEAVLIIKDKPKDQKYGLRRDVYPEVADILDVEEKTVERNIRTVISKSNFKGMTNAEVIYKLALQM